MHKCGTNVSKNIKADLKNTLEEFTALLLIGYTMQISPSAYS